MNVLLGNGSALVVTSAASCLPAIVAPKHPLAAASAVSLASAPLATAAVASAIELGVDDADEEEDEIADGKSSAISRSDSLSLRDTDDEDDEADEEDEDGDDTESSGSQETLDLAAVASSSSATTPCSTSSNANIASSMLSTRRSHVRPSARQRRLSSQYTAKALKFHAACNLPSMLLSSHSVAETASSHSRLLLKPKKISLLHPRSPGLIAEESNNAKPCAALSDLSSTSIATDSLAPALSHSNPVTLNASALALVSAILRRSDGRDKVLKTIVFSLNTVHLLVKFWRSRGARTRTVLSKDPAFAKTLSSSEALSKTLSDSRQILRMFRWISDLESTCGLFMSWRRSLIDGKAAGSSFVLSSKLLMPSLDLLNSFCGLSIDCLDDIEWLGERGVVSASFGTKCGEWSAKLWLLCLCIDVPMTALNVASISRHRTDDDELLMESLTLLRYLGDLVYVHSLVLPQSSNAFLAQCGGLVSGLISLYKLSRSPQLKLAASDQDAACVDRSLLLK